MNVIKLKDGKEYVEGDNGTIKLEWLRGGWDSLTKEKYEQLKSCGMMWEFYPSAPEYWPLKPAVKKSNCCCDYSAFCPVHSKNGKEAFSFDKSSYEAGN